MKRKTIFSALLALVLSLGAVSCSRDALNTAPSSTYDEESLKNKENTNAVEGILSGIHGMMYGYGFGQWHGNGFHSLNTRLDWMTDLYINSMPAFYMDVYRWESHHDPYGGLAYTVWDAWNTVIQHANKVIQFAKEEGFDTKAHYQMVLGEAYLFRAYALSNLVQCYGPRYVPGGDNTSLGAIIRLEPQLDPKERSTVEENYTQILKDVEDGLKFLEDAFQDGKGYFEVRKNRITLPVAYGMVARIMLGKSDYVKAETYALKAIKFAGPYGIRLQRANELLDGFNNSNAVEWMWAYKHAGNQKPMFAGWGAHYSYNFRRVKNPTFAINRSYFDKMGSKDIRRKWFIARNLDDSGRPENFKNVWSQVPDDGSPSLFQQKKNGDPKWEYTGQQIKFATLEGPGDSNMDALMMRLGEMYYIAAEAQARQGKIEEAKETLNTVMQTRDPEYTAPSDLSDEDLAFEVLRNKWIDLFFEGGVFYDHKRIGHFPNRLESGNDRYMAPDELANFPKRNTGTMARYIATSADDKRWVFAIPYDEMIGNKLCKQNEL